MSSFVVTFIAILSFFIISGCGSSGGPSDSSLYALSPSSSKNISGTTGDSKSPVMALDPTGDVYMAWMDKTPGHFEVYFSKSADGGWTFSEPFSVFKTSGSSEDPRMVKDGRYGKIHLAWINTTQVPSRELVYSHSQDKGGTFSRPRALSNVDTSSVSEMTISIDSFSNLLLAWVEDSVLYTSRSIDGGETFSSSKKIGQDGSPVRLQAQADENGFFYLVWEDEATGDIYMATSNDSGLTFSKPANVSENSGKSEEPMLGIQGTDAYSLWTDSTSGNKDIYIRRISDPGASPVQNISSSFPGDSEGPMAAFEGSMRVHAVWEEHTPGNSEIMYAKSSDGGGSFSGFKNLSNTDTPSTHPLISVFSGILRVLWVEEASPSNKELFLSTSIDSGTTFTDPVNISVTSGVSEGPLMGIDHSGIAHWVWVEGTPEAREIYHRQGEQ